VRGFSPPRLETTAPRPKAPRRLTTLLGGVILVVSASACAPATGGTATYPPGLAVSDTGNVAWVWKGRAYLARRPSYRPEGLAAPASASSVAWREGEVWLALPAAGLAYRATGVPASQGVDGRPVVLSPSYTFTESGNVYDATGAVYSRLPGPPRSVLESSGRTWAIVERTVYEVAPGRAAAVERVPDSLGNPALLPAGTRFAVTSGPVASTGSSNFYLGPNGPVAGSAGPARAEGLIAAGGDVVATLASGRVNLFALPSLSRIADIPLEVNP
jgi:hypothetical protein